ncbi:tRNA-splicing endonuclease [Phytophthora palmivora]|uniref:tRNA-splicing endonuclease n=1 Tax=Phytophthora palmivora TaxID=4796 RepID=A0A2P4XE94_9STRA|nr:tRNA-splicing endonuclease [Phytophthora palmivora]
MAVERDSLILRDQLRNIVVWIEHDPVKALEEIAQAEAQQNQAAAAARVAAEARSPSVPPPLDLPPSSPPGPIPSSPPPPTSPPVYPDSPPPPPSPPSSGTTGEVQELRGVHTTHNHGEDNPDVTIEEEEDEEFPDSFGAPPPAWDEQEETFNAEASGKALNAFLDDGSNSEEDEPLPIGAHIDKAEEEQDEPFPVTSHPQPSLQTSTSVEAKSNEVGSASKPIQVDGDDGDDTPEQDEPLPCSCLTYVFVWYTCSHPKISDFPRNFFYGGKLQDGENVKGNEYAKPYHSLGPAFMPLVFWNLLSSREKTTKSVSRMNVGEAELAVNLYLTLKNSCPPDAIAGKVGMITPYSQQMEELRNRFRRTLGERYEQEVEINTVDGFQGREKDIIILSTVRADPKAGVGFLNDIRRMNVALTRAKFACYVIDHLKYQGIILRHQGILIISVKAHRNRGEGMTDSVEGDVVLSEEVAAVATEVVGEDRQDCNLCRNNNSRKFQACNTRIKHHQQDVEMSILEILDNVPEEELDLQNLGVELATVAV